MPQEITNFHISKQPHTDRLHLGKNVLTPQLDVNGFFDHNDYYGFLCLLVYY
jgi:hypothetical protein